MVADYRGLLPVSERPLARFRVGIGQHTALTEPYRHLEEAYAHLSDAYAGSEKAYAEVKGAYEQTHGELSSLNAALNAWLAEVGALNVSRRWWNLPRAIRLVMQLPGRIRVANSKSGPSTP